MHQTKLESLCASVEDKCVPVCVLKLLTIAVDDDKQSDNPSLFHLCKTLLSELNQQGQYTAGTRT
jgi:hypothetical protein